VSPRAAADWWPYRLAEESWRIPKAGGLLETRIVRDFTREVKEPAGGYVITWKVSVNATNPPKN
jgi:hypothetical protein